MFKYGLAAIAALALSAPLGAQAQEVPSYAVAASEAQVQGRITSFDGGYNLQVADNNGYLDNVQLHDGTIINPTGLTLAPGMVVSIVGYADGSAFDANEIDTPYSFVNDVPWYAGHPWDYYGPTFSLGFFFGGGGGAPWWHGGYGFWHGPVAYDRTQFNTTVINNRTVIDNGGNPGNPGNQGYHGYAPPVAGGRHFPTGVAPIVGSRGVPPNAGSRGAPPNVGTQTPARFSGPSMTRAAGPQYASQMRPVNRAPQMQARSSGGRRRG